MKAQSRVMSFVESCSNIAVGFIINFFAQIVVFHTLGIYVSVSENLAIGAIFTFISLVRSFVLRRWFNGHTEREMAR
jgi:hypothetical protein